MTAKERIKELQKLVGAIPDGAIGNESLKAFAKRYNKSKAQTILFFANIHHESGGYTIVRENMNYNAARITQIFGAGHSAKVTWAEAATLTMKPYELAERVYGLGNPKKSKELGNLKPGDGWKYRGGGALQCTGGDDYKRYGGMELYNNPDLIGESQYYFITAIKEFDFKNIWAKAKDLSEESIKAVCKAVNGGYNGLDDRRKKVAYYTNLWK